MKKASPSKKIKKTTKSAATPKAAAKKPAVAKKATPKKAPTKKASTKKAPTKKAPAKMAVPMAARRDDYGAPIDGFVAKQSPTLRAISEALRELILEAAPGASASLKWGMPFFTLGGEMLCAIGGHKAHVNLILPGGPGTFDDPEGRLEGEGKTGQHLKLRTLEELPKKHVKAWLKVAVKNAKG
ncbi:MAG: DUF1801 domain-containing protein [Polyangiaceae bacterium]